MEYVNNVISSGQKRDCTIRAISSVCNVTYQTAELALAVAGKDDNRGFNIYRWLDDNDGRVLGCKFTLVRRLERQGRFMIGNNRHVRAIIDNKIYDYTSRPMGYRYCYRVDLNQGNDRITLKLQELANRGITSLAQWKPSRQSIIDTM